MAAVAGVKRAHATLSTTVADTVTLSSSCKEVLVTNHILTAQPLYVTTSVALTAAGVVTPTVAVAAAAETFAIAPGRTRRVFKSDRARFIKLSVVGNANPYSVEGNNVGLSDDDG